jgi:hypothetical protein
MSKRAGDFGTRDLSPPPSEHSPPPLSEKLIAKLQQAVTAARHNRVTQPTRDTDELTQDRPQPNRAETP